ncbi:hypothetical protein L9F63_001274, partial [Diploptera punctata]
MYNGSGYRNEAAMSCFAGTKHHSSNQKKIIISICNLNSRWLVGDPYYHSDQGISTITNE